LANKPQLRMVSMIVGPRHLLVLLTLKRSPQGPESRRKVVKARIHDGPVQVAYMTNEATLSSHLLMMGQELALGQFALLANPLPVVGTFARRQLFDLLSN
jgi:hypothetical protein